MYSGRPYRHWVILQHNGNILVFCAHFLRMIMVHRQQEGASSSGAGVPVDQQGFQQTPPSARSSLGYTASSVSDHG